MSVENKKKARIMGLVLVLFSVPALWGEDSRTIPIDVHIIVDSSSAMENKKTEAAAWLCDTVVDVILIDGDRVSLWTAGTKPELIYSGMVSGGEKDEIKTRIRGIEFGGDSADYRGALNQARSQSQPGRISYALLVSGSTAKDPPSREAESAGLLLYSRVDNYSGWRVLTVGLNIANQVRESAAAYMKSR
ncbi:MAG: VWA domain-containing protein [Treponema sp.]|jgi:hypothetical protein|nr:VWA domain-containing protein [Treponema sp.]